MVSRDKPIAYHATKDQDVRQLSMNGVSQTYAAYVCSKSCPEGAKYQGMYI